MLVSKFEKEVNGIWYVDTIDPLSRSTQNHKYCLIIVDGISRRTYLELLRNLSSQIEIDKLFTLMTRRGYSGAISRDNASIFTLGLLRDFLFRLGIRDIHISPFQAKNNLSERYVALFRQGMRVYCNQPKNTSSKHLASVEFSLNNAILFQTNYSPFELKYKYSVNDPLDIL